MRDMTFREFKPIKICYGKIEDIFNSRNDIKIGEEIRLTYDCLMKIAYFFFKLI